MGMGKVHEMFKEKKVKILEENEFSKHFRHDEMETDCFLSKAFEEESKQHWIVASIEKIPSLNVMHIQYPFVFEDEAERDQFFIDFKEDEAQDFFDFLFEQIKRQTAYAQEEAIKIEAEKETEAEKEG